MLREVLLAELPRVSVQARLAKGPVMLFPWSRIISGIKSRIERGFPKPSDRAAATRRRARPGVEQLETRLAPAIYSWTGNAGTLNWGDAANWSGQGRAGHRG